LHVELVLISQCVADISDTDHNTECLLARSNRLGRLPRCGGAIEIQERTAVVVTNDVVAPADSQPLPLVAVVECDVGRECVRSAIAIHTASIGNVNAEQRSNAVEIDCKLSTRHAGQSERHAMRFAVVGRVKVGSVGNLRWYVTLRWRNEERTTVIATQWRIPNIHRLQGSTRNGEEMNLLLLLLLLSSSSFLFVTTNSLLLT
jgi:hypothetical protein